MGLRRGRQQLQERAQSTLPRAVDSVNTGASVRHTCHADWDQSKQARAQREVVHLHNRSRWLISDS